MGMTAKLPLTSFGDKIAVVDLEGVILSPKVIVEQLKKLPTMIRSRPSSST